MCIYVYFPIECRNIQVISSDRKLLPARNITYSSSLSSAINVSLGWCTERPQRSYIMLYFTQPIYLLYGEVRRFEIMFNVSLMYKTLFGKNVTYMTVDGVSVRNHMYSYIAACMYMCYFIEPHVRITSSRIIFFTMDTH